MALWLPGLTNLSAMVDQPMMGICPFFFRNCLHKLLFYLKRSLALGDPEAVRDPEYMGVYRDGGDVKGVGQG